MAAIIECMQRIRDRYPKKSLEGIGVSVPGRVDKQSQCLIFAPNLKWPEYDIKHAIERRMGLPTEVENAATACLMSELWFGRMDGVRDAVLITVSEGIGAGILANGQLVPGQDGMAGEFGHISIDPSGPRCACKQNGCWEVFGSCNAALRYYAELEPKAKRPTFHELLNLAEEGNAHALAAIAKQAKYIGRGLRMVTAALSPEIILIAGDVTSAWDIEADWAMPSAHPRRRRSPASRRRGAPPSTPLHSQLDPALTGCVRLSCPAFSNANSSQKRSIDARNEPLCAAAIVFVICSKGQA
jgi:predicted NBD/HSP70 family sugar kinase